jgi:hypothetical protein
MELLKLVLRLIIQNPPVTTDMLWMLVCKVLDQVYGNKGWYKQALAVANKVNK